MTRSAPGAHDWKSKVTALLVIASTLWFGDGFVSLASSDNEFILVVSANPEPNTIRSLLNCDGTIVNPNPR
jgi:hypothetical protein